MADKSFGVKKIELLGDGTPTIESPNDLNLNANTVAISTNLSVGNRVSVSSGVVTSISGVVTYYGDGQYLTGIGAATTANITAETLKVTGVSTLGVTSVTDFTAQDLDVSGIASVGSAITMYGATGIISATQFYGDGSELTGIGAATTANIVAETLKVTGVSTLGDVQIGAGITIHASSGVSTFTAAANTLNVNATTTNAAINIQFGGDTKGKLTPKSDGLEIQSVGDDDVSVHVNSAGGNSGDFIVKSNGTDLLKIDAGDVKSTFSTDVNVGSAITMYQATGIISATQYYAEGVSTFNANSGPTTISPGNITISPQGANSASLTVNSTESSAAAGPEINLVRDDGSPTTNDYLGIIKFNGSNSAGQQIDYVKLSGKILDVTDTTEDAALEIKHYKAGSETVTAEFRSDSLQLLNDTNFSVAGIASVGAAAGFKYLQAPYGSTTTFTVTVASKDATHRYNGTGSSNAYLINGVQAPVLTLTPGRTYRFTNDNTGSHPFKFYYEADRTTLYTTGVDFQNSYTEITVSDTTPNVLHYQCTAHPYMGNAVITNSNVVDSPYPATLRDGLSVTGISSVGSAITMYGATGIVSATKFIGDGSSLTGITADTLGDLASLKVTGLSTFNSTVDVNADVEISGTLSIGGTLTYEDVTNVDSIGLITARDGIAVLGSGVTVTGLSTFYSEVNVGSAITMGSSSGIISATKFIGDGSSLTGISADTLGDLASLKVTGISTFEGNINANGNIVGDGDTDLSGIGSIFLASGHGIHNSSNPATDLIFNNSYISLVPEGTATLAAFGPSHSDAVIITGNLKVNDTGISTFLGSLAVGVGLSVSGISSVGTAITMYGSSGIVSATQFFGDGSQLTGVGGGTSPGQVAFASTAGISTLTSSWTVVPDGSDHFEFTGPGNLSSADDPTIYLQRGQIYEFVINSNSSHPFQIRKTDNTAYTDGVTYTGTGGTNSIYDGTVRFDVPFDAPAELKYVCTNHAGDMNGTIYVTDAAGQGGPTDVADFQNLKVSVASTLGTVEVSSGIITASNPSSGIVTYYGDGQYLTGITAEGTGAIGGLTVKDEGSTVGTAGSVSTLNFVGDIVSTIANTGAAGVATVTVSVKDAQENIYLGTNAGNASDTDTCFNVALGYKAGASLDAGDENVFLGCCAGTNATSGSNNVFLGSVVDTGVVTGSHNVAIGNDLLGNLTSGTKSVAIGYGLLNTNSTTASCNIAIGADSMLGVDSTAERNISLGFNNLNNFLIKGDDNIAIGYCAGIAYCNTCNTNIAIGHSVGNCAGSYNISMGKYVGESYTSANHNIGLGWCILPVANTGTYNIAFGANAGCSLTSGSGNILFGCKAGSGILGGGRNIIFGDNAGTASICGQHNIIMGCQAMSAGSGGAGDCNVVLGFKAGLNLSGAGANRNIFLGACAANTTTTGGHNIALGFDVELPNATGSCQLAIGDGTNRWITGDNSFNTTLAGIATVYSATGIVSATKFCGDGSALTGTKFNRNDDDNNLFAGVGAGGTYTGGSTSCYNLALGYAAMGGLCNDIGGTTHNIAFGLNSGYALNGGDHNFLGGYESGKGLTSGCRNIFIGRSAGRCQTTTVGNIYLGMCAGHQGTGGGTGGDYNIGIGYKAAEQRCTSTSTCNIAIGYEAGFKGKGKDNVALGKHALYGGIFCGCFNIGIGNSAGHYLDDGNDNVLLGREAGKVIEDGSDNIVIGRGAGFNIRDADDNVFVGQRAGVWTCNGCRNVMLGARAGGSLTRSSYSTGNYNNFIGYCAGAFTCAGIGNIFNGPYAGADNTSGSYNIAIGAEVCLPNTTGSCQLAIGVGANNRWITGDNSFNVTLAGIATAYASGIVSATKFCGDGSKLTGIVTATGINTTTTSTFNDLTVTGVSTFLGSVGIGTTNTNHYKLRVDAGTAKSAFQVVGSTGTLLDVVNDATSDIFSANDVSGINAFKINKDRLITMSLVGAGDSVGIGTTLPRSSSKLDVEGIVKATSFLGDGSTLTGVGFNANSAESLYAGTDAGKCAGSSNCYNVAIGYKAGCCIGKSSSQGDDNVFIGCCAGASNASGLFNTFIGNGAGKANTSGHYNVMLGREAGSSTDGGGCNVFLGVSAGGDNATGDRNIGIGYNVCLPSTSGDDQLAIGSETNRWIAGDSSFNVTLAGIATAYATTGIISATKFCGDGSALTGISAGFSQDDQGNLVAGTGAGASKDADTCFNIIMGCNSGAALCGGYGHSILMGCHAGKSITTGAYNFLFGKRTGCSIDTGNGNILMGNSVATSLTTGCKNIAFLGGGSLGATACCNIIMGNETGYNVTGSCNILMGAQAGCDLTGKDNILLGKVSGAEMTSGDENIAIGACAMGSGTVTGNRNIALGRSSGLVLSSGCCNVIIGSEVGNVTTGKNNVMIGDKISNFGSCYATGCGNAMIGCLVAWRLTTGNYNALYGPRAGMCVTTGSKNIFMGYYAAGKDFVTGSANVAIGQNAGGSLTSGDRNIFLGYYAGNTNTTGQQNIAIGYDVELPSATGSCQLAIGDGTNRWITGDSSFNVTLAGIATAYATTGIISATKFCGDGSALTGISAGFSQDDQANLVAGTGAGAAIDSDTCFNVLIGCNAGASLNAADYSIFIGADAGRCNQSGQYNTGIGKDAFCLLTSGHNNIAMGYIAGRSMTSGTCNLFFGAYSGFQAVSANNNAGFGVGTLKRVGCCGQGNRNSAFGDRAGNSMSCGCDNTFLGHYAGKTTQSGSNNVLIGSCIWNVAQNDSGYLAIGVQGNRWITGNGDFNVGIGTTNPNAAVGVGNTAKLSVGIVSAYQLYGDGSNLTGLAGFSPDDQGNLYAGTGAGAASDSDTCFNIGIGNCALKSANAGDYNLAIGYDAGCSLTSGKYNVLFGMNAAEKLTTGCDNIVLGRNAMGECAVTGYSNVTIGCNAGNKIVGGVQNVYIGTNAAKCMGYTGGNNVVLGTDAMRGSVNLGSNIASNNVVLGQCAGYVITSGSRNFFGGYQSGCNVTSGQRNIMIGPKVTAESATGDDQLAIGSCANRWIVGDCDFNVCLAGIATVYAATGIVSATKFCGDGSSLTGISAGFTTTGDNNLVAGYNAGCNIASGGCNNIVMGTEAGKNLTTSDGHVFIGMCAGYSSVDEGLGANVYIGCNAGRCAAKNGSQIAFYNVAIGYNALLGKTGEGSGTCHSVAIGNNALKNSSTGRANTAIGECAGQSVDVGAYNFYGGYMAGSNQCSGNGNVMIGRRAGFRNRTGYGNVVLGQEAACSNNSGNCSFSTSVFIGNYTAKCVQSGSNHVYIGDSAGMKHLTGYGNVYVGKSAGCSMTSGNYNSFFGTAAACCQTEGCYNIAIGYRPRLPISDGSNQFVIGCCTCNWIVGNSNFNVGIGTTNPDAAVGVGNTAKLSVGILSAYQLYGDGSNLSGLAGFSPDAQGNLIAGTNAGEDLDGSSGVCNVFIGQDAGRNITSGEHNVLLGSMAGCALIDVDENIMIGKCTGRFAKGSDNIFFGTYAGSNAGCSGSGGDFNIALGSGALRQATTGTKNIAIGCNASYKISSGNCNVTIGSFAGRCITTGCDNIVLGHLALGAADVTGSKNIILGCCAGADITSSSDNIALGMCALCGHTTGHSGNGRNIAIGCQTLATNNCFGNIAIGALAGCGKSGETISFKKSIFIGEGSGAQTAAGNCNIFVGHYAGKGNDTGGISGDDNIAIGQDAGCTISSGQCNILIGKLAGKQITTGTHNVITGPWAGSNAAITGAYNNLYGYAAGYNITSGYRNSAFGNGALYGLTTGRCNVAIGPIAGYALDEGCANIAIGYAAGCKINTGNENIAIGNGALNTGTVTGDANIAIGPGAAKNVTSGLCNIAIGMGAICTAAAACCNIAIGVKAGRCMSSGDDNVFLGFYAGENVTTGSDNVYVGKSAGPLTSASSADHNVAMGLSPGHDLTTGCCNVFIGYKTAQGNTTGYANVYLGGCTGPLSGTDSSGYYNFATGWRAFCSVTSGRNNIVMGTFAGRKITTGKYNVAFGEEAMSGNSSADMTGNHNFSVGKASSYNLTTGEHNFVAGHYAFNKNAAGNRNVAIGEYAQQNRCSGNGNISLGHYSLIGTTSATDNSGSYNLALGEFAGRCVCSGNSNVMLGYKTGCNIESGSMNIMIGCDVRGSAANATKEIVLGYTSGATGKGTNTFYVHSDQGVYHAGNTTTWSTTSDLRIKKNVTDNNTGLDKIKEVQVRNFEYRTKDEITDFENPDAVVVDKEGLQLGVIAQEIQKVLPDTVTQQSTGALGVNADNLTWYLINAVKELSAKNDALEERIKKLEGS